MAQNIIIAGNEWDDVPQIHVPKTGGGVAQFDDTSDANATADDIAAGKTAYVNGMKVVGEQSQKQDAPLVGQAYDSSAADYVTPTQVYNALKAGRDAFVAYVDQTFGTLHFDAWNTADSAYVIASQAILPVQGIIYCYQFRGDFWSDVWYSTISVLATGDDLATKADSVAGSNGAANKTASIPFGQVDATSTSTVFTATIDGITELRDGVCVYLKNGVVTSASGCTLNINNLGAKPIYQTMAATTATTTAFNINYTMLFVYNSSRVTGGCWDMFYGYNANTTYSAMTITEANTGTATTARTITASVLHQKINNVLNTKVPDVAASDNGKFLRVVNGAWAVDSVPSAESEAY